MKLSTHYPKFFRIVLLISILILSTLHESNITATTNCIPLKTKDLLIFSNIVVSHSDNSSLCYPRLTLRDDFKGNLFLNQPYVNDNMLKIYALTNDSTLELVPVIDENNRICELTSDIPLKKDNLLQIIIPEGMFEISPDYIEVKELDLDEDSLTNLSIAGAWHKKGDKEINLKGMFSIIDDDSLDGQISSSAPTTETYGYFSILYPLLEGLGLKGNLAVEGRRTGFIQNPPKPNDNLKTILRLQDEKGWDILSHSMLCIGERLNNWMVDSLTSPLASEILATGPNNGVRSSTVSVYDMKTKKQYWPNSDNTLWIETPSKYIKPYIGDYNTKKEIMYNPDFDIAWHWGEWKRVAIELGVKPKGFVTHNSTSSHAMVPGIMEYFPYGFSDLSAKNINTIPMLSTAVRAGLEGNSMKGYNWNDTDNTFNKEQFKAFCAQIDETVACGGWIMFNLHAYHDVWKNSLPGMLVSEGGSYPDEWVIPMKGVDSANDPLTPPANLGISDWSEWYPCPGTRLDMMWQILKYAKQKGLVNVTSSQGFELMGNKKSVGYFNQGYKFGMNARGIFGTRDIYPHYVVAVNNETFYYNPLISEEITFDLSDQNFCDSIEDKSNGKFVISGKSVTLVSHNNSGITLKAFDMTGRIVKSSNSNQISFDDILPGTYIVCALRSKDIVKTIKLII